MNYPLISEYIEAIKWAEDNFEELSYLRPVWGEDGLPVMTSGNFAVVFKMKDEQSGKSYAVKCFTKEQDGRAEAYREIAKELENVSSPYILSIRYLDKELFVDTDQTPETEFPVLLMDWVEGKTLDKYLRENLDDKYALEMLAYRFSQLAQWLIPQDFAHGDLKPDNILVREDGTLVLVDYDGMYVPAMKGQQARELGSPDFRHPLRTENDFDEHIDDFSIIAIQLSLNTIYQHPDFYPERIAPNGLLLSKNDYKEIQSSLILQEIQIQSTNKADRLLIGLLWSSCAFKTIALEENFVFLTSYYEALFTEQANEHGSRPNNWVEDNIRIDSFTSQEKTFSFYLNNRDKDSDILWKLGLCYEYGYGTEENRQLAEKYYVQSAEQDNPMGQYLLGYHLYFDIGDYQEGTYWLTRSARNGSIYSQTVLTINCPTNNGLAYHVLYNLEKGDTLDKGSVQWILGCIYREKGDNIKAYYWVKKGADNGDMFSLYLLGNYYFDGIGTEKDYSKAFSCYAKAACHGIENAQACLGQCYWKGIGCEKDHSLAFYWFNELEEKTFDDANWYLAFCYEFGIGTSINHDKSYKLFSGLRQEYEEELSEAEFYEIEMDFNDVEKMYRLSLCYANNLGGVSDDEKAKEWYQKAIDLGYIPNDPIIMSLTTIPSMSGRTI